MDTGIFIDRGPMSNGALCKEMDNETCRIRYALQGAVYYVQHISFRTGRDISCLIIEARAW
jgi:hypothetical protein